MWSELMLQTETPGFLRRRSTNGHARSGAVALELALTLPLLLVVLLSIIEIGRAVMVCQTLTNAARLGVRRSVLPGATNDEVGQVVKDFCASALNVEAQHVSVQIFVGATGNQDGNSDLSLARTGDLCKVGVAVPFERVSFATPGYLAQHTLTGSCVMEHE
jgi:Flp pilus assembly protein TadG